MSKNLLNVRNVVTSCEEAGWNYGYSTSPLFEFDYARSATYLVYNGRLMPISFSDSDRFDDYWALRQRAAMFPTGELRTEIKGSDAERLCNRIFTRDISKLKPGRCGYGIACYWDGGLVVDGVLMRLGADRFCYVQAEGQFYSWVVAHSQGLDVQISDPEVWVNQVQGPLALEVLNAACDDGAPDPFGYFGVAEVTMAGQRVLVSRTLPVSRGSFLEHCVVQREISYQPLQPTVLPLKILQPPSLVGLHPAELLAPADGMDGSPSLCPG